MKLKDIDKYWHLLEAAREGKTLEKWEGGAWVPYTSLNFCSPPEQYRVKPEEEWRNVYLIHCSLSLTVGMPYSTQAEADKQHAKSERAGYLVRTTHNGVVNETLKPLEDV